jgi:hypothetical protein
LPLDGGLPADAVDLVHQIPCPLVGHVHRAPRGRNRAAGVNVFQELYLAGPDPSSRRDRCGRSAKEAIWRSVSAWKIYSVAQGGQIADYNLFERRGDRFARRKQNL